MAPHLFVDISAHGLGHLAQVAPVLNALRSLLPALRLTVRSGVAGERLRRRIDGAFTHVEARSDFGFLMHDALRIDAAATARAYREAHADWPRRVAAESEFISGLGVDLVLADAAYLPLAGAAAAGVPALAMSSLNWADLFAHFFGDEPWAAAIHREMLAAYDAAEVFLRLTPAMPMPALARTQAVAPVAARGADRRRELCRRLAARADERIVLVGFGGVDKEIAFENWPRRDGLRWLIPASAGVTRADFSAFETIDLPFPDLVRSVDAVLTKPGYGMFTEAACNGTAVLFVRRDDDWPEQDCLIDWLHGNARCAEVGADELAAGAIDAALERLWRAPARPTPSPDGACEVAGLIAARLRAGS